MKKLTVRQRVENWLDTYGHLINKQAFEREIKAPRGTLQKYTKYSKQLNNERITALNKLIKKFKKI